ncbi:MBL fold metallo-hydrolase [Salinarchaeum laminariae]|uniref:MBL fold metallo-hydrolase n=1 Tax=Salinarchaeum laminariae TaxID=869888 RepID=UPI0020BED6F5|nr:MBL fold metallo-hydrolase [Salinarchaeum laminariae]
MIVNVAAEIEAFTSNVFLVEGERRVLVDAGAGFDVVSRLEDRGGDLDAIVLTHAHPDHVGNVESLRSAYDAPMYGFDADHEAIDHELADGDVVQLGDHEYEVLFTPGHAPDHCCLYADTTGVLFAGDLVFQNGGYGRTDLPGADRETLLASIQRVLDVIDEDLRELHTGHGPSVTEDAFHHVELAARSARAR